MRILVVGAGAIGGYFGGRLLQAGRDVTFLVRPRRAGELASAGLVIKSPNGDVTLKNPPTIQADAIKDKFDVVLLSCKAFDLDDAINSFAVAVGPNTAIIPMLNGMKHLDTLDGKFGKERVLGGLCAIAATLNEKREVVQLQPMQSISYGERDGKLSDRVKAIDEAFKSVIDGATASQNIMQDMWEKWVFLSSLAASTSLMRASVGDILAAPGGRDFLLGMLDETSAVAAASGYAPGGPFFERVKGNLTTEGSPMTASMFRDVKAGLPVEADHVIGDLIARAETADVLVGDLLGDRLHLVVLARAGAEKHQLPLQELIGLARERRNVLGLRDAVLAVTAGADGRLLLDRGIVRGACRERTEREKRNRADCVRDELPAHDWN